MPPKGAHALIPRSCKYVTPCGEKDFADVIMLRILSWEDSFGLSGGPNGITRIFTRGRQ